MTFLFEFKVIEHYPGDEQAPEDLGFEWFPSPPLPGQRIPPHWLDGRVAYDVQVTAVDLDAQVVHVERIAA